VQIELLPEPECKFVEAEHVLSLPRKKMGPAADRPKTTRKPVFPSTVLLPLLEEFTLTLTARLALFALRQVHVRTPLLYSA